ncbi:helix-turn-helix transcriptional regulator [Neorhizobium sp. IRAMC:178]|uniref:helix-turn-helix domain-containing protein n=1 Tax=Neorhizobium tunisiense TaxID=3144793 RepID=UPI0031F60FA8
MSAIISSLADRSSVRYEGRAKISDLADIAGMAKDDWKSRLLATIEERGTSQRRVSLDAGLGPGYVNSWFNKEQKEPTVENLLKVCAVLNVSVSYILFGVQMSAETEEILHLLEKNPETRDAVLKILRPAA